MHIGWTPHLSDLALLKLLVADATIVILVIGRLVRPMRRWRRYGRRKPVLHPQGRAAAGPVSISGLKLRLSLIYDKGPRRYLRPVALYAATGHRGADGRVVLDLLHTVCLTQHQPRTFRVDRILAATDMRGTEIRDLSGWVMAMVGDD